MSIIGLELSRGSVLLETPYLNVAAICRMAHVQDTNLFKAQ
jgi:hypothetical protein